MLRALLLVWLPFVAASVLPDAEPRAGAIEGTITLRARRPARAAPGYAAAARPVPALPTVVYLLGRIEGAPVRRAEPPTLVQRDTSFQPSLLVVPVGTSVEFPNQDPFFHNVFSYSKPSRFDLGRYRRGESKTVKFDQPGVVRVFCEVHNWMRAAVIVVENPLHTTLRDDGSFRIPGVPAGRYRLAVWSADRGEKTVEVQVPAEGTARVDLQL